MKHLKKVIALVIAAIMMVAMTVTVFAAGNYKITIEKNATNDTHTYEAYQIIKGDLDTDENSPTKGQLKNLEWADGVDGAALLTALKADPVIGAKFTDSESTVAAVASAMAGITSNSDEAKALAAVIGKYAENLSAKGTYSNGVISGLEQGYYIVKDVTEDDDLTYDTKSEYMLQVVGDVTVKAKDSSVSLEKKVNDQNDTDGTEDNVEWKDTADHDVGDLIAYRLKGTLPSNFDEFDFFSYKFTDTMDDGLTLKADSVRVYMYANEAALTTDINNGFSALDYTQNSAGTNITDKFDSITPTTDTAGATLVVDIQPVFDSNGKVTSDTGLKTIPGITKNSIIVVYYLCELNENAVIGNPGNPNTAELEYSNNPNATGVGDNDKTTTPQDKNVVFTYKVSVDKVDENGDPLDGAEFTLYKVVTGKAKDDAGEDAKLGSAIKTSITTSNVKKDALDDDTYYVEIGKIAPSKTTGDSYTANFERLDDGVYVLVETKVPTGYNAWESKSFSIETSHAQDPENLNELLKLETNWDDLELDTSVGDGALTTSIENNSGSILPSTGGIGTTIFYILGAILVLGSGVILITRKRMSAN